MIVHIGKDPGYLENYFYLCQFSRWTFEKIWPWCPILFLSLEFSFYREMLYQFRRADPWLMPPSPAFDQKVQKMDRFNLETNSTWPRPWRVKVTYNLWFDQHGFVRNENIFWKQWGLFDHAFLQNTNINLYLWNGLNCIPLYFQSKVHVTNIACCLLRIFYSEGT